MNNENIFQEILITEEEIKKKVINLAREIEKNYNEKDNILFVGLLKGCAPFMMDLINEVNLLSEIDFMNVSSYAGEKTPQKEVQIIKDLDISVKARNIIIVEDVIDTGRTLKKVKELLEFRGAQKVEIVTMIDKPGNRAVDLEANYVGKVLGNEFIVGYGLDYKEYFRNIRTIGIPTLDILKEIDEKK